MRILVAGSPRSNLDAFDRVVAVGWRPRERPEGVELLIVDEGPITRRKLLDLLVAISSGVEEIVVDCDALTYRPVAEAILAYRWLLEERLKLVILGSCCEHVPLFDECSRLPSD